MNIVVVEDQPTDLKLLKVVLAAEGHTVGIAQTAHAAFDLVKEVHPDVLLIDLRLPDMDGLSLARLIKDDPNTKDIPIVAMTAYRDTWTREAVMAAGCDAYIAKPVDTRTLAKQLASTISKSDS